MRKSFGDQRARVITGWAHYKWLRAFGVDAQVQAESTPYLVDSTALYSALLCLASASGVEQSPEFRRLRTLVEAKER